MYKNTTKVRLMIFRFCKKRNSLDTIGSFGWSNSSLSHLFAFFNYDCMHDILKTVRTVTKEVSRSGLAIHLCTMSFFLLVPCNQDTLWISHSGVPLFVPISHCHDTAVCRANWAASPPWKADCSPEWKLSWMDTGTLLSASLSSAIKHKRSQSETLLWAFRLCSGKQLAGRRGATPRGGASFSGRAPPRRPPGSIGTPRSRRPGVRSQWSYGELYGRGSVTVEPWRTVRSGFGHSEAMGLYGRGAVTVELWRTISEAP